MYTKLWCYPTSLALNMDCPINSKLIILDLQVQEHTEFLTSANTTTASSVISQRIIRINFPPSIKLFCILSLFELNSSSIYLRFQSCSFRIQQLSHLSTIPMKKNPLIAYYPNFNSSMKCSWTLLSRGQQLLYIHCFASVKTPLISPSFRFLCR